MTQGATHFSLELVPCLRGVPAWRPCEWDLRTRRRRLVVPFHREGEHGVFILRLARFVHADIGAHRGTAAVTVRFTRQFLAANAEACFRRGIFNACQLRQFFHYRVDNVVELRPVHFTTLYGAVQGVQPAPAFQHHGVAVVVRRIVNLEETLGATFVVDNGTVAFCEACRREHQVRFVHDRGALMVNDHYQRRFGERGVNASGRGVAMQVVFQHHNGVSGTGLQFA